MSAEVPGSKATYKQSVEVAKSVNIRSLILCKQLFYISIYSKVCFKKKENECYGTKKGFEFVNLPEVYFNILSGLQ